jgi:hypothetical protein
LLNDEWHGLSFVAQRSLLDLFLETHHNANSIPMNLYRRILLDHAHWSENLLRLPPLLAGLALLLALPALAVRLFTRQVAWIATGLVALSPVLILFSRTSRAYSVSTFLAVSAFLLLQCWLQSGKQRYAFAYLLLAPLAVFFHLTALFTVGLPLLLLFMICACKPIPGVASLQAQIRPKASALLGLGIGTGLLILALLAPAMIKNPWLAKVSTTDHASLETLQGFLMLSSGSSSTLVATLFWISVLAGLNQLRKTNPLFAFSLTFTSLAYLITLALKGWETIHIPLEFTRFCMSLIPLICLAAAAGCVAAGERLVFQLRGDPSQEPSPRDRFAYALPSAVLLVLLALTSPLWESLQAPNSYTNHLAYSGSTRSIDWERSYTNSAKSVPPVHRKDIPEFYFQIEKGTAPIIEYPSYIGDSNNHWYYYQHFHQRPVIAGYFTGLPRGRWAQLDEVFADMYFDHVLTRVDHSEAYAFKNMIDIWKVKALRESGASHIIVHRNPRTEGLGSQEGATREQQDYYPSAVEVAGHLKRTVGEPIYDDGRIAVFSLLRP